MGYLLPGITKETKRSPFFCLVINVITVLLWCNTKKTILYAKYYETPFKFHSAINGVFQTINQKYNPDLKKFLTLKFQFFEKENVLIYPV